jgi:protein phosphatase 1 regulatory subunit 11
VAILFSFSLAKMSQRTKQEEQRRATTLATTAPPEEEPSQSIGTITVTGERDIPLNNPNQSATESDQHKKERNSKVKWDDSVVDNEGMGRKSSKICCIYKKPWQFGESSSDESSSDDANDDKEGSSSKKNAYERQPKYNNRRKAPKKSHSHDDHSHDSHSH